MIFKEIMKSKIVAMFSLIIAVFSYLKFTAVLPASHIIKKQQEESIVNLKKKTEELRKQASLYHEINNHNIKISNAKIIKPYRGQNGENF